MPRLKKTRSTLESRKDAWDRMCGSMALAAAWDKPALAAEITRLQSFTIDPEHYTQQQLLAQLAVLLAYRIIDAA